MLFGLLIIRAGTLVGAPRPQGPYEEFIWSPVVEEAGDLGLMQSKRQLLPGSTDSHPPLLLQGPIDVRAGSTQSGGSVVEVKLESQLLQESVREPKPHPVKPLQKSLRDQMENRRRSLEDLSDIPLKAAPLQTMWLMQVFEDAFLDDIFAGPKPRNLGLGFFAGRENLDWIVLGAAILIMVVIDTVFIRPRYQSGMRFPLFVLAFWVAAGGAFNAYVYLRHGLEDALQWWNGYFLEWILSMDNLFVFHLVFKVYKTPETLLHKALFWGIIGAIVFRVIFFMAIGSLLHLMHWFRFVFGIILIISGIQAAREDGDDDLEQGIVVRALRCLLSGRLLPPPGYDKAGSLLVWQQDESGTWKLCCTMLIPVIMCLEMTDILFAVDSVTAKVAQIPDQYIAYSSSIFAMFGLRSLFFIVEELVNKLRLLKYGLCFILVFIGFELIFADYVQLPASVVCLVLIAVFGLSVLLSVLIPEPKCEE